MTFEIELKAHIPSLVQMQKLIKERLGLFDSRSYKKEDVYFSLPETTHITQFRLRTIGNTFVVTRKNKSRKEGIEVNDEIEFTVSDAAEFTRFALDSGYIISAAKIKVGKSYTYGDMTIEVSDVEKLGFFIEMEILLDTDSGKRVSAAKKRLLETLEILGIERESIEPRYYIEMLHTGV
ncbi:MAG: class IV adenylate cyclase [Spirochaetales bacterium]|nr:class IV adenylate cyclase [Spirochaetales bacterium]